MLNKRLTHWNIIIFLVVSLVFLLLIYLLREVVHFCLVRGWLLEWIVKSQMTSQVLLALEIFMTNLTSVNHREICITQQTGLREIVPLTSLQMFHQLVLLPKLAATEATLVFQIFVMSFVFRVGVSLHHLQTNLAANIGIVMFSCLGFIISRPIICSSSSRCLRTIFGNVHVLAETALFVDTFVSFQVLEKTESLSTFIAGIILLAM